VRQTFGAVLVGIAAAASAHAQELVSVRGVAFDSLRNAPLSGAFIAIAGSSRSAVTDARGRFRIDSLSTGTYTFAMQHDVLDSIGFSGRSVRVAVGATTQSVTLAVPSFATLWRGLCGGPPPKDSGIVYGSVRDLSDKLVPGASVGVTWQHVSVARRQGIDWKDMGGQTVADSTGRYALCGVPVDVALHLAAASGPLKSGVVDLTPLTLRVARRDFRLAADSGAAAESGTVIGSLTGDGGIVRGAIVSIAGVPEVRSDDSGRFVLRDVPAGTRQIEARAIGAAPVTAVVDVKPRETTTVTLSMGRVQTLAEVNVTARTFAQVQLRDLLERRESGLGYFRDSLVFQNQLTPASAYDGVPSLQVKRLVGNRFKFVNTRGITCENIAVWLDKVHVDEDVLSSTRPEEIAAYEVYLSFSNTPAQFQSRGTCGAVVVWTKRFLRS
jgi:hypothetical protein